MQIENNKVVSLRYVMKDATGEVMEDNTLSAPFQYLHGTNNLVPSLEKAMSGLSAGDKKSISITDEQLNRVFFFDIIVDDVRATTQEEIEKGTILTPIKNNDCNPGCCC